MITGAFFDLAEQNADYESVETALVDLVRPYGVITASCVEIRAAFNEEPFIGTVFGKRDTEYLSRYRRGEFARRDVTVLQTIRSEDSFSWQDVMHLANTPEKKSVFNAASEHGYNNGWIVPNHGAAGSLGLTTFVADKLCDSPEAKRLLTYAGLIFYRYAKRQAHPEAREVANLSLSKRQHEIAYWVSQGKTDWEIALLVGIRERTVHRHMEMLRKKLNVRSRAEMIAKIYRYHLLDL